MTSMVWTFAFSASWILPLILFDVKSPSRADEVGAQFLHDGLGVVHQRLVLADGQHAHLLGREPEREVAGVMLDEKADEPFVRAQRRAMDAQRRLVRVVLVAIDQAEAFRARRSPPGWWPA